MMLRRSWLQQVVIWISYFILLVWFYSETTTFEPTLIKSVFIILIQAGVFYLNLYVLLPSYFEQKAYSAYFLFVLLILIVSLLLFYLFDQISFQQGYRDAIQSGDFSHLPRGWRGGRGIHGPPPWSHVFRYHFIWKQVLFHGFFVVIVLFISTIYRNMLVSTQKEREALELKSRASEAESNMLKYQINPHFLFNTLNNIYSMAQLKSGKTADAVHRLSEMLRYVIYDCSDRYVPLNKEIAYVKSYIELQLLKDENMDNVHYHLESSGSRLMIAPMILISFVENSFKHSKIEDTEHSWIRIELTTTGSILNLSVKNSIPEMVPQKNKISGIGLDNVKKRLQLLYPGRHLLHIGNKNNEFAVDLKIELNES